MKLGSVFIIEDSCKNGPLPCVLMWSEVLIVTHWRLIACKVAKSCFGTMFSPHSLTWFTWSTEGSLYVKWQSHVLAQCLVLIVWLNSDGPLAKSCFGTVLSPHSDLIQLVHWKLVASKAAKSCFGTGFSPHSLTWFSWSSDKIMFCHNV